MGLVEETSLAGSILRKSHRQSGHRVATEKTRWPKAMHFAFVQVLIAKLTHSRATQCESGFQRSTSSANLAYIFSIVTDWIFFWIVGAKSAGCPSLSRGLLAGQGGAFDLRDRQNLQEAFCSFNRVRDSRPQCPQSFCRSSAKLWPPEMARSAHAAPSRKARTGNHPPGRHRA